MTPPEISTERETSTTTVPTNANDVEMEDLTEAAKSFNSESSKI